MFGLVLLVPVLILIGIFIKLSDSGPIFFRQQRVGKNGKLFVIYKFRSMRVDAAANNGVFEPGNISRITTIGAFIRKNKLDELPQLYNVLIGDMSIVGPRPEVEKWVKVYPEEWRIVHSVKPGITDNASIEFRNEEQILSTSEIPEKAYMEVILPRKLLLYEQYVENQTFLGDLIIIFQTLLHITK